MLNNKNMINALFMKFNNAFAFMCAGGNGIVISVIMVNIGLQGSVVLVHVLSLDEIFAILIACH